MCVMFQLSHFFSEMDRSFTLRSFAEKSSSVSIEPLLFRNG